MLLNLLAQYRLPTTISLLILLHFFCGCRDITKKELIEDIHAYEAYIDEIHADPYRLITKEQFKNKAKKIKKAILQLNNDHLSQIDAFFYLQELSASLQDYHTRIHFPSDRFTGEEKVFPLILKMISGKYFVVENLSLNPIPAYCSLIEINGIPIDTLYKRSTQLYNTSLDHAKYVMFENDFHFILILYLNVKPPWRVKYEVNSNVQIAKLDAITVNKAIKSRKQHDNRYKQYSIFLNNEEIPILYLPNFHYGTEESYKKFIDSFFLKYKNSRYMIIDLRRNSGGSGYWGFYLLDYFTDSPYQIAQRFEYKVSEKMRNSIYANKVDSKPIHTKNGEYLNVEKHQTWKPHETYHKFKGQVFLLISEKTFSAGVVFAAVFKANKMGIVVGRETSGRVTFCSDPVIVTLPNSKLKGKIPLAIYALPGKDPDHGIKPDIEVSSTIDDYRLGKDVEMEKIKKLIQEDFINRNGSD